VAHQASHVGQDAPNAYVSSPNSALRLPQNRGA
jgi:hypothetical protein